MMLELSINSEKAVETKKERETAKLYKKEADELRAEVLAKDEIISALRRTLVILVNSHHHRSLFIII